MYNEKLQLILKDIENKNIEIAGGSVVGIVLSTINSLIKYICNLTIGKKKYLDVEKEVLEIKNDAELLKKESLNSIDEDKKVLENILISYKTKKEDNNKYQNICKTATEFCLKVAEIAVKTLNLSEKISKVGNKMLSSDFEICKLYSIASVKSAIVNIEINLISIEDGGYVKNIRKKIDEISQQISSF